MMHTCKDSPMRGDFATRDSPGVTGAFHPSLRTSREVRDGLPENGLNAQ